MACRICTVTAALVGAALLAVILRELPGGVRELRIARMAKWKD